VLLRTTAQGNSLPDSKSVLGEWSALGASDCASVGGEKFDFEPFGKK